jgi:hypothetical protein
MPPEQLLQASAFPTKRFFMDMLTRDIALEDALLDLVDNSIDALGRTRHIDFTTDLFAGPSAAVSSRLGAPSVSIELSNDRFRVADNCGGIPLRSALTEVFRIGRTIDSTEASLGVYGIGLKRALFKIGKRIKIISRTTEDGFEVDLNLADWSKDDDNWDIPLRETKPVKSYLKAGTEIIIEDLNPAIVMRLEDGLFKKRLSDLIATTYSLFLQGYLAINLDGKSIEARSIPIGVSKEVTPAVERFDSEGVSVTLIAALAERRDGEWNAESAGWYVLCNGRVVVGADKTELTGWGLQGARFVSKYRGFIGIAFFSSKNPHDLPWTTTKRGLNLDSPVFQRARAKMSVVSKPVLNFLNRMYASDAPEEINERQVADNVRSVDVRKLAVSERSTFEVHERSRRTPPTTVNVQYQAERVDIERIKRRLRKPSWSAGRVGRYTLDYFIGQEFSE